ncbi:hypothetical protein SKUL_14 [Pseudomonas phage Skulduggery]|uniref:Uncharacterized protein n=1 Tax=Pseudomonas phage Skulduggery TaxID=2006671 RepID=A0A1Y0SZB0_9CAUD|nr:virion structural protein [Pseudomonas phage Skulduggery]ARV77113.1 hypothetical protein SKUL_14 [Pseudomonas phage Skulduggery]
MAIKQSEWALGNNQAKRPQTAGAVHAQRFRYNVVGAKGAIAAGDILEIGELPPYCKIVDAKLYTNGTFTGLTADVGLLTGEYGDALDAARTVDKLLFDAADLTVLSRLTKTDGLKLEDAQVSRGIGLKFSAAIPAAAAKYIVLELDYIQ